MSKDKELIANNEIKAKKVRVIFPAGRNEVMTLRSALNAAANEGLDLVQMNQGDEPTCKIMDFANYKYQQKQAEKARKKKQRETAIVTKEIKLSVDIQEHDLDIRRKQIDKFLDEGKHVMITLKLKGRAKFDERMKELARDKVELFIQTINDFSFVNGVSANGATISVTIKRA